MQARLEDFIRETRGSNRLFFYHEVTKKMKQITIFKLHDVKNTKDGKDTKKRCFWGNTKKKRIC